MLYWSLLKSAYSLSDLKSYRISLLEKLNEIVHKIPNSSELLFLSYDPIVDFLADFTDVYIVPQSYAFCTNPKVKVYNNDRTFNVVIALNNHLSFFKTELDQMEFIKWVKSRTNMGGVFITSLADYKNTGRKRFGAGNKEQIHSNIVSNPNNSIIFHELSISNPHDQQAWTSHFYSITDLNRISSIIKSNRRTMYFKQLAKFTEVAGRNKFSMHGGFKSLMTSENEYLAVVEF